MKMKPIINSFAKFKETIRPDVLIDYYTGTHTKAYNLIYGFRGNALYIQANNMKDAYREYKRWYQYYDKYIPENSFLKRG